MEEHFDLELVCPTKLVEEKDFDFVVSSVRQKRKMTKTRLDTRADEELGGEDKGRMKNPKSPWEKLLGGEDEVKKELGY